MKTLSKRNVLINALLAFIVGFMVQAFVGSAGAFVAIGVFALGTLLPMVTGQNVTTSGALNMALQTEVWVTDIQENLFYENEFLNLAVDHSSYVKNSVVHVPQAGTLPNVVKNRSELVADIQTATDTELTYGTDNYTTDPFLVKDIETLEISYDKRQSVMGRHIAVLGDTIATNTLQKWAVNASTTHVIRTSGEDSALEEVLMPSATGTRKLLTKRDLARAAAIMDKDKVPKAGRFALLPTEMYYNLFTDAELVANQARLGKDMIKMGVVGEIHKFKIMVRGDVIRYTSAAANNLRDADATAAGTDCAGAICFSRYAVTQALGEIKMFYNAGEARSYGDILSAEVNHGAHYMRENNYGRVCIAQAVGA